MGQQDGVSKPLGRARHIERQARARLEASSAPSGGDGAGADSATRMTGDERWKEILSVAARMFAERGYPATSLQQIADELKMLKGSLYYYINSKDDLLYEVIRTVYWDGMANFQQLTSGDGDALTRLRAAIEGHVRYLIANITATAVYLYDFNHLSPARQAELSKLDYSGWIRDLISEGQRDHSIRADLDPSLMSMAILGSVNWVYRWYRQGQGSPDKIAGQFAEVFTSGLAPRQDTGPAA